MQTNNIIM